MLYNYINFRKLVQIKFNCYNCCFGKLVYERMKHKPPIQGEADHPYTMYTTLESLIEKEIQNRQQSLYFVHYEFKIIILHSVKRPKIALLGVGGRFWSILNLKVGLHIAYTHTVLVKRLFNYCHPNVHGTQKCKILEL